MKRLAVVFGVLLVLAAVFWMKVEHATWVCGEAHGRWADGDCLFDEPPSAGRR